MTVGAGGGGGLAGALLLAPAAEEPVEETHCRSRSVQRVHSHRELLFPTHADQPPVAHSSVRHEDPKDAVVLVPFEIHEPHQRRAEQLLADEFNLAALAVLLPESSLDRS